MRRTLITTATLLCLLTPAAVTAQTVEAPLTDDVVKWFAEQTKVMAAAAEGQDHLFVKPGVQADRKAQTVEILAVAVGLGEGTPAEFFLAGETGRDYESVAMTAARPLDIQAALKFIGLVPGRAVDFGEFHFWPRGPRVAMTAHWNGDQPQQCPAEGVRVEDLVVEDGKPLIHSGLTFAGSKWTGLEGERTFQADVMGSVACNYNDPWTILDVPYVARQGHRYGHVTPNPAYKFEWGQRLRFQIRPLPEITEIDLTVRVLLVDNRLRLAVNAGDAAWPNPLNFKAFLDELQKLLAAGQVPFLKIIYDDDLPAALAAEVSRALRLAVDAETLRIEPAAGQLYYEAWMPQPQWRNRKERIMQPAEIRIIEGTTGEITRILEDWSPEDVVLKPTTMSFATLPDAEKQIEALAAWPTDIVFFFVPPTTPCGIVTEFYSRIHTQFPTIYIFVDKAP
ncbi:MAG TPA: hypothetical protein DIT01_06860 [Lentisphaeria bacterium]|nr:hypothetical protein [Lentisphaeria bacterium]